MLKNYSVIDECTYFGTRYLLLEDNLLGDIVPSIVANIKGEIICKTYDTLLNALETYFE